MKYTLDIDMYKKGYTIQEMDCVQNPIAGSCGAYSYELYYVFGFYLSVMENWGARDDDCKHFVEKYNRILEKMNITLIRQPVKNSREFYDVIEQSLKEKTPVLLPVRYSSTHYHKYYKDDKVTFFHQLLVSDYNTEKEVMTVRDCRFFDGVKILETDGDIMFPIQLRQECFWDMLLTSLPEQPYIIKMVKDFERKDAPYSEILQFAIDSIEKGTNLLCQSMDNMEDFKAKILENFERENRRYACFADRMYRILNHWIKDIGGTGEELAVLQDNYVKNRKKIMYSLYRNMIASRPIPENKVVEYKQDILNSDSALRQMLIEVKKKYFNMSEQSGILVDLSEVFNNKAFDELGKVEVTADISGTGIFFVMQGVPYYEENKKKGFDNVSCKGQKIFIPRNKYRKIRIFACAEYGSYKETLSLYCGERCVAEKPFNVSDFYMNAMYDEKLWASGEAYQVENEKIKLLDFRSKIFEYDFFCDGKEIDSMKLPDRKNIHIFGCTLFQ